MTAHTLSRREAVQVGIGALGTIFVGPLACNHGSPVAPGTGSVDVSAHARTSTIEPGLTTIDVGDQLGRTGFVYVPAQYDPAVPMPMIVMLHGAGGRATQMLTPFEPWADASGAILVAFSSFAYTWDAVIGRFGVDTDHAAKVIAAAFDRCAIDPARVGLAGFSDGATYALALGRANGNLFTRVAAFSPGYLIDVATEGKPEFFISHGTSDGVLFIDNSSRKIVPWLRKRHYEVDYREFDGGHQIPKEMADIAIPWLAAAR